MVLAYVCGRSLLCAQEVEGGPEVRRAVPVPAKPVVVPKGRITGHIYCADTHKPARGATLLLVPVPSTGGGQVGGTNSFARAGMSGSFDFEHVAPGEYSVIGLLPGYLSPMTQMAEETQDEQMGRPQDPEQQKQWMQGQAAEVSGAAEADAGDIPQAGHSYRARRGDGDAGDEPGARRGGQRESAVLRRLASFAGDDRGGRCDPKERQKRSTDELHQPPGDDLHVYAPEHGDRRPGTVPAGRVAAWPLPHCGPCSLPRATS